jgi:hypothetical protein
MVIDLRNFEPVTRNNEQKRGQAKNGTPCISCALVGSDCFEAFRANACEMADIVAERLSSLSSFARSTDSNLK